ncbi:uncharacterized protein N7500_009681 [Penicillium coprophilum]|uniref:uncharacterized protein n=1 Tax=Penicillium coprophilum TaxID=36646 RepID=UPI0023A61D8E|nr:uncharacterized protein N7500_009681 [Penicillium coprophilum]KAJ5154242.1 hypothetical protein N7500_009681 [Penicillium coprophilum]
MECGGTRIPYAKWRLSAFRRLLATSHQAVSRGISTSRQSDQFNETTLKAKTNNSNLKSVPPSQRLPQSPLITRPRSGTEKNRKRRPTAQEEADLLKNPWAVMLASPARMCSVTGARLPSALLGTWGLVRQPNTDELYMMPVGLLQDSLQSNKAHNLSSSPEPIIPAQVETPMVEVQGREEDTLDASPIPTSPDKQTGRQLVLRIAELLPLIRSISVPLSKKGGKRPAIMRLLPFRWKHPQGPVTAHEEKKIIWSANTPEIMLQGMRGVVVKKLSAVLEKYKRIGTSNGVWRSLDLAEYSDTALKGALGGLERFDRMECGAVLLLGPRNLAAPGDTSQPSCSLDSVALTQTGSKVPVFDLSVLFAESDIQTLRASHAHFQHPAVFFRPEDQLGTDAMISLWKMKRLLDNVDLAEH